MKFKIGDRVFYPHLGATGTVMGSVNASDRADRAVQGPRYEVRFGGVLWSVLERSLLRRSQP